MATKRPGEGASHDSQESKERKKGRLELGLKEGEEREKKSKEKLATAR